MNRFDILTSFEAFIEKILDITSNEEIDDEEKLNRIYNETMSARNNRAPYIFNQINPVYCKFWNEVREQDREFERMLNEAEKFYLERKAQNEDK